jgi:hypothetical protein
MSSIDRGLFGVSDREMTSGSGCNHLLDSLLSLMERIVGEPHQSLTNPVYQVNELKSLKGLPAD